MGSNKRLNKQRGISKVTGLVFAAMFLAVGYVGYRVTPFFYYYYELQNQIEQLVRLGNSEKEDYLKRRLMEMIERYEIPADEKQIKFERRGEGLYISVTYSEFLDIKWRGEYHDLHEFKFKAEAQYPPIR